MSTPLPVDKAWTVATALRDCLCERLSGDDDWPPPFRCCVLAGPEAVLEMDGCCYQDTPDGPRHGQAWARIAGITPAQPRSGSPCPDDVYMVTVELGVVRCAPTVDDDGNAPSCEELESSAYGQMLDSKAMRLAATCCDGLDARRVTVGQWVPLADGGCVGGTLLVTYQYSVSGAWGT